MDFLRINKKSYIRGKDIGDSLIETINIYKGVDLMLGKSLLSNGLFRNLYEELFKRVDRLIEITNMSEEEAYLSAPIMDFYDTIVSLETLSDNLVYTDELINKIKTIFNDGGDGVCLSTIHKAKGLEADNVFILAKSLMPSIYAHQEWERVSEENLEYVAITRAKKTLQYINEDKFKIERNQKYLKTVIEKFEVVKKLLGTKPSRRKINVNFVSKPTLSGSINHTNNSANAKGKKAVGALKYGMFIKK